MNDIILMAAYGMNTDPIMMDERVGNAVFFGVGTLNDYGYRFAYHADVYPCAGDSVSVVLWCLDKDALTSLDDREGYPWYYDRSVVDIMCDGALVRAWLYRMREPGRLVPPSDAYLTTIRRGYSAFGLDQSVLDAALALARRET